MKVLPHMTFGLLLAGLTACSHTPSSPSATDTAAKKKGEEKITLHEVTATGVGKPMGTVVAKDTPNGLQLMVTMKGLTPGLHGFHVHENASCAPKDGKAAFAAGGHYDPAYTGRHEGPTGQGHAGDLPPLVADEQGNVDVEVDAAHLTLAKIKNHALVVHAGGDNFSDQPEPLGGGGARVACGVVM